MSIFGRAYETDPRVKCFCRRKRVGEEREESIFDQTSGSKFSQNFNFKILTKLQIQYYNQTTFSFRILTKPRQLSLGRCYQNCHLFWQTKITGWPTDHQSSLSNRVQSPSSDEASHWVDLGPIKNGPASAPSYNVDLKDLEICNRKQNFSQRTDLFKSSGNSELLTCDR